MALVHGVQASSICRVDACKLCGFMFIKWRVSAKPASQQSSVDQWVWLAANRQCNVRDEVQAIKVKHEATTCALHLHQFSHLLCDTAT